jgi:ABC-type spermidine/putrescine transport system permease subunit I
LSRAVVGGGVAVAAAFRRVTLPLLKPGIAAG